MSIKTHQELASANLKGLIDETFQKGIDAKKIVFTQPKETEVIDDDDNLTVELKVLESLEDKDKKAKTDHKKDFNPFLEPEKELVVVEDLLEHYRLLMNKFPVSPNHLLLTTKEFKNQDDLLTPAELVTTYGILKNLNSDKKANFFAFYNSGPQSGFSQKHRHIQFVQYPLKGTKLFPEYTIRGKDFFIPKDGEEPLSDENIPFKHYILPLPKNVEDAHDVEEPLTMVYISLFRKVLNFFKKISLQNETEVLENNLNVKSIPVSYNLIMNQNFVMVVPRQAADYSHEGIGINAVGFVGLLLAKNEAQKEVILDHGVSKILKECGFPNDLTFNKEDEYDY